MENKEGGVPPAHGHRIGVLAALVIICIGLEVIVHFFFKTAVGYTHIFYILLVLSALWYYKKALLVAGGLVCAMVATSLVEGDFSWATILRAVMFFVITWIVASISEERDKAKADVQAKKEEAEKRHYALVGYLSEATLRLKAPLETLRDNLASMRRQIDRGVDTEDMKTMLSVQIAHLEQIIENFRELNQEIVEERDDIPQEFSEFLTR